jgi:hypothetical protein
MKFITTAICGALFSVAAYAYPAKDNYAFPSQFFAAKVADTTISSSVKKPKKVKAKKGGVTVLQGSAESRSERDRRLMRECRGRPNAGLCEGYARP